jgi:lipoprotein-releasing system ATP-binding protein
MDVTASNLTMQYHDGDRTVEVFRGLDWKFPSGTSTAIVGESGVGKTTLLLLLGGLEKPVEGKVLVGGTDLTALQRSNQDSARFRGASIGFVFQFHHLLPEFDAVENVALPLIIAGKPRAQADEAAERLLTRVGLKHRLRHRPGQLSGGEQQRVAIARALVAEPGVVLADEPTGNLDLKTGGEVTKSLLELQKELKQTLIVVTHSLEVASQMDHVIELTPQGLRQKK